MATTPNNLNARYPDIPGYQFVTAHNAQETEVTASIKAAKWLGIPIDDVITLEIDGGIKENRWASYVTAQHASRVSEVHERLWSKIHALESFDQTKEKHTIAIVENDNVMAATAYVIQVSETHYEVVMHSETAQRLRQVSNGLENVVFDAFLKKLGLA